MPPLTLDAELVLVGDGTLPPAARHELFGLAQVLSEALPKVCVRVDLSQGSTSSGGNYVNFQLADDDRARTAEAYGKNYERLRRVKGAYEPDNVFRVNRNILPALAASS